MQQMLAFAKTLKLLHAKYKPSPNVIYPLLLSYGAGGCDEIAAVRLIGIGLLLERGHWDSSDWQRSFAIFVCHTAERYRSAIALAPAECKARRPG